MTEPTGEQISLRILDAMSAMYEDAGVEVIGPEQTATMVNAVAVVMQALMEKYADQTGVPGMSPCYPATERDEGSEYEYAWEDAPLLQEDRR